MSLDQVVCTVGLTKAYRKVCAVRDLNLSIPRNKVTAFLGRNGAGKSTTIKMLLGLIKPTSGTGTVLGRNIEDPVQNCEMRQSVAYVAENKPLYPYMTVEQHLRFSKSFYADWRPDAERRLLAEYALPLHRKVKTLSKGMRTKLALLLALARHPELVILDEPSEGLDPVGIEHVLETIFALRNDGVTVFFSSHQISEVERVADRVCILDRGALVIDSPLERMRQDYRRIRLTFSVPPPEREFRVDGVARIQTVGCRVDLLASKNSEGIVKLARTLEATSIEVLTVGLNEIFLDTVRNN